MVIYKCGQGFELGTTKNKSSKWPERDLNLGPPDCESNTLTTPQHCLQIQYLPSLSINYFAINKDLAKLQPPFKIYYDQGNNDIVVFKATN